jgi:hypothetical protein
VNAEAAKRMAIVEAPVLHWLTAHGNICLALRHPNNAGASRSVALDLLAAIELVIRESGVLNAHELAQLTQENLRERAL